MSRKMSEPTLAILTWFKDNRTEYHALGQVREAFPGYDPKLIDNCMRTLIRNGSIARQGEGQYGYDVMPETVAVQEPGWIVVGRRRAQARAMERKTFIEVGAVPA